MGSTLETVVFYFLAAFIIAMSIMTVTTQRIVRSATYLLFVLFGTAGIYFLLGYTFLGSVQIMVYAGGIVVLYVFSILLTSGEGDRAEKLKRSRFFAGLFTMVAGAAIILFITLKHNFLQTNNLAPQEINIHSIGHALLSSDKYGYILPFEAVSILLLACIIGGIMIARKRYGALKLNIRNSKYTIMIHMEYYLVVSTIMMFAGIYGFFTRRNTLAILISVELMLNATDINFAVFNRFLFPGGMEGYFFALFSIAISAAETAIAIAIMINIYRNIRSIQVRNLDELKW